MDYLVSKKKKYIAVYRRTYQLSGCLYCSFRCADGMKPPKWVACDGEKQYFKETKNDEDERTET